MSDAEVEPVVQAGRHVVEAVVLPQTSLVVWASAFRVSQDKILAPWMKGSSFFSYAKL